MPGKSHPKKNNARAFNRGNTVRKYKVSYPEGAAAAEMATATADDVNVHRIQCCIRGYHVYQRICSWYPTIGETLGTARERASWAVQPLPSNILARVHPWVSFEKS